jgi:hypothetical protein
MSGGGIAGVVLGCIAGLVVVAAAIKRFSSNSQPPVVLQQVIVQPPPPQGNPQEPLRPSRRQDDLNEDNLADFIGNVDIEARKFVNSQWPASLGAIAHVELNPELDGRSFALQKFKNAWNAQSLNREIRFDYVWHGTGSENICEICLHGFDPAKRNAQWYGAGEYFGANASISDGYCRADGDGMKRMIVAIALRVPQTTFHANNTIVVVNNPTSSSTSYVLPVLVVTYGRPPQNYTFRSAFQTLAKCDRVLYHRTTSLQAAMSIKQGGFNVNFSKICPSKLLVGRGLYFATHPRSTFQKTIHQPVIANYQHGALLRVTVSVGLSHHVPFQGQQGLNQQFLQSHFPPLSSVRIPRNDWNAQQTENGAEYVVFDDSQVKRIEIVSQAQYAEIPTLP